MNKEKNGFDWQRTSSAIICIVAAAALIYLFGRYLFDLLLPFIVAALIAAAVSPLAKSISRHSRIPRRIAAAALVFILLLISSISLPLAAKRLITELRELAAGFGEEGSALNGFIGETAHFVNGVAEKLSSALKSGEGGGVSSERIDAFLSGLAASAAESISAFLPSMISSVASSLPRMLLALAVTVISAFYFALDKDRISEAFTSILPTALRSRLPFIKKEAAQTAGRYLRAYSLILLITFSEVFFGLSIIGVEYAFLLALIISIVDVLPVLGVGTVLVPWSIVSFITGELRTGTGLLILYISVVIVRQFIEPKIIGESLGIHPLLSLISMYIGLRLFGILGVLLAPAAVVAIRSFRAGSGKSDLKDDNA